MADFDFKHRDGLSLSDGPQPGTAVLRWQGCPGTVLTVDELRWLVTTSAPAALAALTPSRAAERRTERPDASVALPL